MRNRKKGFTLIELLVVVAIIGILSTVATVSYLTFIEKAKRSNDIQLVSNINHILITEEGYQEGPHSGAQIINDLEQRGFDLKTESKGVNLYYNYKTNMVELGEYKPDGYIKIFPEDNEKVVKGAYAYQSKDLGKAMKEISSPEQFINGYALVGTSSRDGLADAINTIRNPKSDNELKNALEDLKKIKNMSEISNLLDDLVLNSLFITKDSEGNTLTLNKDDNVKKNLIISRDTKTLNVGMLNDIEHTNMQIIELSAMIEDAEDEALEKLSSMATEKTIIVSEALKEKIIKKDQNLAEKLVDTKDRNKAIKTLKVIRDSANDSLNSSIDYSKETAVLSMNNLVLPSLNQAEANKFVGIYKDAGFINKLELEQVLINNKPTNNYKVKLTDDISNIYVKYEKVNPTAQIGEEYFDLSDAIEYSSRNNQVDTIRFIETAGEINKDITLDKEDILYLPCKADDEVDYKNRSNGSGIGDENYVADPNRLPTRYSELRVLGNLFIEGETFVGGVQYSNNAGKTGTLALTYAEINLSDTGKINVLAEGSLYDYGKITGSKNDIQLVLEANSNFYTYMSSESWRGNSVTEFITGSKIADEKRFFPVGNYNFENNYVRTKINKDSNYNVAFTTRVSKSVVHTVFTVIGSEKVDNDVECLFDIQDGYIEYYNNSETNRLTFDVYGDININKLKMNISDLVDFDSDRFILSISGRININAKANSNLNLNDSKGIKLLPGSVLNIEEGANLNVVNTTLAVYEWSATWNSETYDNKGYNKYYELSGTTYLKESDNKYNEFSEDAKLILDGTMNISNSSFAGHATGKGKIITGENVTYNHLLTESNRNNSDKGGCGNKFTVDVEVVSVSATRDGKSSFNGEILGE